MAITLEDVKNNKEIESLIIQADKNLESIGFTEHGLRHSGLVANIARNVLTRLSFPERISEIASIAGYLHDIGNVISRNYHGISGAMIAHSYLVSMGMPISEVAMVMNAVGNSEEEHGSTVNEISAAVVLGDKSDVHHSRVRNPDPSRFDIHDRVNFAARKSFLDVDEQKGEITLKIEIDTKISQVMEYFEIFLDRMTMCRKAAEILDCRFKIVINDNEIL